MDYFEIARQLVREFKGDTYLSGPDVLKDIGSIVARASRPRIAGRMPATRKGGTPSPRRAVLVHSGFGGIERHLDTIRRSVAQAGVSIVADVRGARPNAPREDLLRITDELQRADPDVVVSFGGGSTIDAVKAAEVLRSLGGSIDDYFGTGLVTKRLQGAIGGASPTLHAHVAIQTAAGSGAHLTKYSNITDLKTGQKKLIVDEAIVPAHPVFDHTVTYDAPPALTADGALDGLAHILEVFYGAIGKPYHDRLRQIAEIGITLIVNYLPKVKASPRDTIAREALCLATDLGAYAIMLGGTNGGHLTSFSLVDILSHGRACAVMNPYYTVFFAPALEGPLRVVGKIFTDAGHISRALETLQGRDLGIAVAEGMFAFARAIGFPTTLGEVPGFTPAHIHRALTAAKNPQLKMKLENMPIPLTAEMIDGYMAPILAAATTGDVTGIRNVR